MRLQRPVLVNAGAAVCLGLLGSLTGCGSGAVPVSAPHPTGATARACRALVKALPRSVSDQKRRAVEPPGSFTAAWGDPPIVLRCGVPRPAGLDKFATCQVADGVGWYIPERQITGRPTRVTMTTVGRAEFVEVRLPADYWPPAAAMVDLAKAVKDTIPEVRPCL